MQSLNAWIVVSLAAGVGSIGLFFLTRGFSPRWLRLLVRLLIPVWLVLPAPVPQFPGSYAPAFLIALFEGLFQVDGQPGQSLRLLLLASVVILVAVVGWSVYRMRRDSALRTAGAADALDQ
jgi:hypothetical protein